jgi:hypothetical protein
MKIKLFEKTFFTAALILFCFALLRFPADPSVEADSLSYWAFGLALACVLAAVLGRKTWEFFRKYKSPVKKTEDPTLDSFISEEEWKEFVSDGCH